MNNYTILDAAREIQFICNSDYYIKELPNNKITWNKVNEIIDSNINWFSATRELKKVEKLSLIKSKCPFRKNY